MSMAIVTRLFTGEDLEIQKPDFELVKREQLSQEELEKFKNVLERYAKGDLHTRLSLYLYHRDLRETFELLDRIG